MNLYSIPTFVTSFIVFLLGLLVFVKNKRSLTNKAFSLMCLSTTVWLFFASLAYNTHVENEAEILMRISYLGISFIAVTMFNFVVNFLEIQNLYIMCKFLYFYNLICCFLILTTNLLISGVKKFYWGYYPVVGWFHPIFLCIFILLIVLCVFFLIRKFIDKNVTKVKKTQILYLLLAIFIFDFSSVDFIPNYGIEFYPFGYVTTTLLLIIVTFSIIRYRFLDVSLIITRFSIFVAVYSIVLGIPFAMAFGMQKKLMVLFGQNWWVVPLMVSTVFSILGPRIYLYFQKRAEDRLLQEQRQYQDTMRKASLGMGRIKDLKRLLNLIVHVVTRTVRIEHCEIFLLNKEKDTYELKAFKSREKVFTLGTTIPLNSPIIQYLKFLKEPILAEDMEQRSENSSDRQIFNIQKTLKDLDAEIVVPSFIDQRLISLIVLGKKRSGKSYSQDDLVVFSILANQSALAIENALFYEDVKRKNEQLFKAEKMATIGTMADGLSHQINNRLHAMGFIAGDALDSLDLGKKDETAPEMLELFTELEHAFTRIQKNVSQGGEVVEGLLKWTRKTDEGFGPVHVNEIFDASLEMIKFKIKLEEVEVIRNAGEDLPPVKGNLSQLQEVFFNIIDNSYDSMMQRKNDLNEPDYKPVLNISAVHRGANLEIVVSDNGIGVKPSDVNKLFTPFFTTKISSRKGTGLGLYVIRQIIEKNHAGRVEFTSDYHKGAQTKILLPLAHSHASS